MLMRQLAARYSGAIYKFDLLTGMVGEFDELQGIMGEKYALLAGEKCCGGSCHSGAPVPTSADGECLTPRSVLSWLWLINKVPFCPSSPVGLIPSGSAVCTTSCDSGGRTYLWLVWLEH